MSFKPFRPLQSVWRTITQLRADSGVVTVAIASLAVTGFLYGVKQFGWLEPLELRLYDRLVRLRPDEKEDPRLLIVEITEEDLRRQERSTPNDQALADVLMILERYHPQVIGVDLHRDLPEPPGTEQLRRVLQTPNIVAITKLGGEGESFIPPPPGVAPEQIGFNDLLIDPDGVIRRNLLFATTPEGSYSSFSLQLALKYLEAMGIFPKPSANPDYMQLGNTTFVPLNETSGGYQVNDALGYQILLNYRSPSNVAQHITFSDVLDGKLHPDWVRGRIVLIGTTAVSGKDLFYTPYSAGEQSVHQMSGVAIHAQSISQILSAALNQRPLMWFWADWVECLWTAAWAVMGGSLAWWIRHPMLLAGSGAGLLASLFGICFFVLTYQGWIPLLVPGLGCLLSAIAVVTHRAQQAHRQQQMVMTLLGQNTSPEIANALWDARDRLTQSGKLPGQKLIATMLFTDIKGFSTVSEAMTPDELLDWLNEYLEAMTQVIQNYHGIINKFTGDGLLAVFGVPIPQVDREGVAQDAYRAVACALAMGDRLQELNHTWRERGLTPVQMRVGIFTGLVVVGSLGGRNRMEYGVIGDSVNIASRLESCAKDRQPDDCRILIAYETLEYVKDWFQVESWGLMALKGKQQMVEVYRVMGYLSAAPLQEEMEQINSKS